VDNIFIKEQRANQTKTYRWNEDARRQSLLRNQSVFLDRGSALGTQEVFWRPTGQNIESVQRRAKKLYSALGTPQEDCNSLSILNIVCVTREALADPLMTKAGSKQSPSRACSFYHIPKRPVANRILQKPVPCGLIPRAMGRPKWREFVIACGFASKAAI
jgi:hypothetical protein